MKKIQPKCIIKVAERKEENLFLSFQRNFQTDRAVVAAEDFG